MKRLLFLLALLPAGTAMAQDAPERVVMTLDEFLRLYEQAANREDDPEPAPRSWSIASARYKGEVLLDDGEPVSARFRAKLRVEVLKEKGWTRIPLLPTSVALSSARIAGSEAPIALENGYYTLVTDRHGAFDVDVEFAASVFTSEGSSGLSFQLVASGATELDLTVPATEMLDFTVANAQLQEDRTVGDKRMVHAVLPATGSLAVSWQREIPEDVQQEDEPRLYAEVYTLVGLGDGLLTATSTIHHTILFEGVDTLKTQIPADMTLLDVRGSGIRDWSVSGQELTVSLNYAAEGAYPLTLEMERLVGEGDVTAAVPMPIPLGVERSKGWVGVQALGNLEISGGDVAGASPVDVRSLPGAILGITSQPVLLGYKYLGSDASIPLQVTQHDDVDVLVTLLDQAQATTMWTPDGRRLTSVRYQVRNNRKQFLRLSLPDNAELWSASVGGRAVQPAQAGDGRVLIPLLRSQDTGGALAAFQVEVVYVEPGEAPDERGRGTFRARLPSADVPTTYVSWSLYAPWDAKIKEKQIEGALRPVERLSNPIPAADAYYIEAATPSMQSSANAQVATGGLGQGAAPVPVSLPVEGQSLFFEKLLALDEELWLEFPYRGLDD